MTFNNILVDIDALAPFHPAMEQAVDLARRAGARITIVDVIEDVPRALRKQFSERLEEEIVEHRTERLRDAVAAAGPDIDIRTVVLRGRPVIALVQQVLRGRHDLLVRYHARDPIEKRAGFDAVDMQLMRKCPAPVWLVGVGERTRPRRVLAAINPNRDHTTEQALNRQIVEVALEITKLERGSLTVMTSWMPFGAGLLDSRLSPAELRQYVRTARQLVKEELDEFVASLGAGEPAFDTALVKGEPQTAIPRYCRRRDIDLVVMGTVARSGVMGAIMGNTAERVLQQLKCSVMALKPEGFRSPITLEDE